MLEIRNAQLDAISTDLDQMANLSNIGEIGIAIDYSDNQPANEFQNRFPLVDWLLRTSQSRKAQNAHDNGSLFIHKDTEGVFQVLTPWIYGTTLPEDTTGECCWIPLELTKCGNEVPIYLLCLKDCYPVLENLIYDKKRIQPNDLTNYFQRAGETVREARRRMAKTSMAWFTAHNIILGTTTTGTNVLKPFHGLLEVLEDSSVIKIVGSNILAGFDSLACRLAVMGTGDYVIAVHPLTYEAIASEIQPGQFGQLPAGWTKDANGTVRFHGMRFVQDVMVPVDATAGTGEAWFLDGDALGAIMGTTLQPADSFTRETFTNTNNPEDGCASECEFYYNYGTVFTTNPNRLAVMTDIPLSANCLGASLNGLDLIIQPETIVPINN